ncbi:hypothetical protein Psuf_090140 [Phytohabitans suffuscus]|uniref:Uncharacterized protein n=1 Tax=Phytohabitans suffuscus TaxID=624315 RepID=A0A6F8Z0U4_9ACTN|nr:GvpL/GvpF family gas vesicle protein [Phytohabitans suffuscus]BCB91701.1 hypothetical protein Psuf_090140 [Phytohabitans suffuscus]
MAGARRTDRRRGRPAPGWLRARPRDLLAHQLVLDCLWQGGPVLPARYGIVAPDERELRAALRRSAPRHLDALARVAGRVEMDVGVHPAAGAGAVYEALRPLAVRASAGRFLVDEDTVDTFLSRVAALDRARAGHGRVRATGPSRRTRSPGPSPGSPVPARFSTAPADGGTVEGGDRDGYSRRGARPDRCVGPGRL